MPTSSVILSFVAILGILIVLILFFRFVPLGLWISARASGVRLRIISLITMRFRRVTPSKIVLPMIKATKAGLDLNMDELEAHFLAGGSVDRVVDALIAAQSAQIPLEFEQSRAIDLAGRDVLEAVMALPQAYREALYLHYYEGYTAREIAQMTDRTEDAVAAHLSRGRAKLRAALEGADDDR